VSSELSAFDDYPFHQGFTPFHIPVTSDSHYQDGYYFAWYRPGEHWFCGLRVHANNNVMDGYAGVVYAGEQRSIRFSRALHPHYDALEIGPFRLEILEPMVRQRVRLDENPTGLTFEIDISSSFFPFLESEQRHFRYGRLFNHVQRYSQATRAEGWASLDGDQRKIDWHACRDHSWGIRSTMGPYVPIKGVEPDAPDGRAIRLWVPFEVDDHFGFFHMHEDHLGRVLDFEGRLDFKGGRSVDLVSARHTLQYHPDSRRLLGGAWVLEDEAGRDYRYEFEVSCEPAHPQGFGYTRGWSDGGQPGVYRGSLVTEVDRFQVNDPAHALGPAHVPESRRLGGTEFTATLGGPGGTRGMAHVEHMIYGAYEPYGFE
jgi:hypothetical protein